MIKTFKDAETQKIYQRERSRKMPSDIQQVALRKLRMINNAINVKTCESHQQTILKNQAAIEKDSIASV